GLGLASLHHPLRLGDAPEMPRLPALPPGVYRGPRQVDRPDGPQPPWLSGHRGDHGPFRGNPDLAGLPRRIVTCFVDTHALGLIPLNSLQPAVSGAVAGSSPPYEMKG